MATQFDQWLAHLKATGHGPVTLTARRGVTFSTDLYFPGDLTGTTIRGEVRASPDAVGLPLAEFNVSAAVYPSSVSGKTKFNVALVDYEVTALPADGAADGIVTLYYDLLVTFSGENEELLFGGPFAVMGRITGDEGS